MKVKRTGRFKVKASHPDYEMIKLHTIEAKEIYNYANYIIRQLFFKKSGKENFSLDFINEYSELAEDFNIYISEKLQFTSTFYRIICKFSRIKKYSINSKMVQNIVDILKRDWKSYWKLLKLKIGGKYDKKVNIPKYKKKYSVVEYNPQVISKNKLKNGYIGTSKMNEGFKIPNFYKEYTCKSARSLWKNDFLYMEIIYEKEVPEKRKIKKVAAADLGGKILMSIAYNFNRRGISISANMLRSLNHYYNKMIGTMTSLLPKGIRISKAIQNLWRKRDEQVRNLLGYYANKLIKEFKLIGIDKFIIGKNKEQKQEIDLHSKLENRNFCMIPFNKLVEILKYKCEENGIECMEQEESYTSKASFLNNDFMPVYGEKNKDYEFSGWRNGRTYKIKGKNQRIHADLNGALNIMRKAGYEPVENISSLMQGWIFPIGKFKVRNLSYI
jgi:transposase, IS605 orfB family